MGTVRDTDMATDNKKLTIWTDIYNTVQILKIKIRESIKGIVQRDLTGVETRLKKSLLMNYIVAKFAFWILKEHHHERSIKLVSAS
jgi:hypothetical protein